MKIAFDDIDILNLKPLVEKMQKLGISDFNIGRIQEALESIPDGAAVIYVDPYVTKANYAFLKKGESKLKTENIYIAGPGHSFL